MDADGAMPGPIDGPNPGAPGPMASGDGDGRELVQPEVMEGQGGEEGDGEQVTRPTKLNRIASMVTARGASSGVTPARAIA